MIVDCFPYFKEKELLELRINLFYDYFDKFIICDGNYTHSGIPKEYTCKKIIDELQLPKNKIEIIEVQMSSPEVEPDSWVREREQRNAAASYINDGDVCFIADCDEIINPSLINYYANVARNYPDNILRVPLVLLNGRADLRVYDEYDNPRRWDSAFMCLPHHVEKYTLSEIRESRSMSKKIVPYDDIFITENGIIPDSGWHFSWIGNSEILKEKCISSQHVQDNVIGTVGQFGSKEMLEFMDTYIPYENSTDPLGRKNHILKKYDINLLPKEIFNLPKVKEFLLP